MAEEKKVGDLCVVKLIYWKEWQKRTQTTGKCTPQVVTALGTGELEGYAMLSYPFYWWRIEELRLA